MARPSNAGSRGESSYAGRWFGGALLTVGVLVGLGVWEHRTARSIGVTDVVIGTQDDRRAPAASSSSVTAPPNLAGPAIRRHTSPRRAERPDRAESAEHGDPEDAMEPDVLLRAASDAYARKEMAIAYRRAAKAASRGGSEEALELKAKAACALHNPGVARAALSGLSADRRRKVRQACREAGERLGAS